MAKKKVAEIPAPPPDVLKRITTMATLLQTAQKTLADKEEEVRALKEDVTRLERESLPELMKEVGLSEVKLTSGLVVSVRQEYDAKITEKNKPKAFAWLIKHGFGGLIKTVVAIEFPKGAHETALEARAALVKSYEENEVLLDETVHAATLKSFVKERMQKGEAVPADLFGVFTYSKATIKSAD